MCSILIYFSILDEYLSKRKKNVQAIKQDKFKIAYENDIKKLPQNIKEGIKFYYVEDYTEVFKIVFP